VHCAVPRRCIAQKVHGGCIWQQPDPDGPLKPFCAHASPQSPAARHAVRKTRSHLPTRLTSRMFSCTSCGMWDSSCPSTATWAVSSAGPCGGVRMHEHRLSLACPGRVRLCTCGLRGRSAVPMAAQCLYARSTKRAARRHTSSWATAYAARLHWVPTELTKANSAACLAQPADLTLLTDSPGQSAEGTASHARCHLQPYVGSARHRSPSAGMHPHRAPLDITS